MDVVDFFFFFFLKKNIWSDPARSFIRSFIPTFVSISRWVFQA